LENPASAQGTDGVTSARLRGDLAMVATSATHLCTLCAAVHAMSVARLIVNCLVLGDQGVGTAASLLLEVQILNAVDSYAVESVAPHSVFFYMSVMPCQLNNSQGNQV
jgi:hypothetical protein